MQNTKTTPRGWFSFWMVPAAALLVVGAAVFHKHNKQSARDQELAATEQRLAQEKVARDALLATLKATDDLVSRWEDATRIAGATSRVSLAAPVAALQALKREADAITVPPCLDAGKPALVEAMTKTVDGFVEFMTNQGGLGAQLSSYDFEKAKEAMARYRAAREACPV